MITRAQALYRLWRRRLSRSELTLRVLGLPCSTDEWNAPGLVMIQFDGLSHGQLLRALHRRKMPFLARLLARDGYALHRRYSGLPSSTPGFQAELFNGVKGAVPAFSFRDHGSQQVVRILDPIVECELLQSGREPLLKGGSSYSNIYSGGAAEAYFCPAAVGWGPLIRSSSPVRFGLLLISDAYSFVRVLLLLGLEGLIAVTDCLRGTMGGQRLLSKLTFVPVKVGVSGRRPRATFVGHLPTLRIDHVFVDRGIEVLDAEDPDSALARIASDHLLLLVELNVPAIAERADTEAVLQLGTG